MYKLVKLVRDGIEDLTPKSNDVVVRKVDDHDVWSDGLRSKLMEEVGEYLNDRTVEEIADIIEVALALGYTHNYTHSEVLEVVRRKYEERGGFEGKKGLYMRIEK